MLLKNPLIKGFIASLFVIISIFVLLITGRADTKDAVSALTCYILASVASITFYVFASKHSKLAFLPEHIKGIISAALAIGVFSITGAIMFGYRAWAFPLLPILLVYVAVFIIASYEDIKG
ncbi:hypothetical protein DRN44_03940 [Thermococci archaeon]|nr:MAG: hypothetical protein DRN44_03940 [Thermococci archaeon]